MGLFGLFVVCFLYQSFGLCWSLNDEGLALLNFKQKIVNDPLGALANWSDENGETDPCSWCGVHCSDRKVVSLNLKDLCLEGTLTPEITRLVHIKSIILRNNSFSGKIPAGIGNLQDLEVIDFRQNSFAGPPPSDLLSNLPDRIILLDDNKLLGSSSPEIYKLHLFSRTSQDKESNSRYAPQAVNFKPRKLLQDSTTKMFIFPPILPNFPPSLQSPSPSPASPPPPLPSPAFPPLPPPSPATKSSAPQPSVDPTPSPPPTPDVLTPTPSPSENRSWVTSSTKSSSGHVRLLLGIGGAIFFIIFGVCMYLFVFKKVPVRPWATGLSGQLEKAFVTGVPNLKRSELETACEDFSNVIGVTPIGTVYKGTLSSGVEIAVACLAAKSTKDWPETLELQFRTKIDMLSKVNHKNFVNLIGYCEEEQPFTRMMVFEYAPNGTLFEHLHIQEAEHLDWGMRLRIAVGMASCLQHMHQLNPPIIHGNLTSSAVNLTEDYAAKLADMSFWNETRVAELQSSSKTLPGSSEECNVYSFGVILFETMTGRVPYSVDSDSLDDWAADYLRGEKSLEEIVDPTLKHVNPEQLEMISGLMKLCTNPDSTLRPKMADVSGGLRSITGISPEEAAPRLSPLWWAELEIMSTEAH